MRAKTIHLVLLPILLGAIVFMSAMTARGSERTARRLASEIVNALQQKGYEFKDGKIGYLGHNKIRVIETMLYRGVDYAVVAAGDEAALDVDVYVLDERENVLQADRARRPLAGVRITPPVSGQYYIVVHLVDSYGGRGANFVTLFGFKRL